MKNQCNFENCGKLFPCQSKLQDHMNTHFGLKPFGCKFCLKKFYSKKQLWAHNQTHSSNPIKCAKCNMVITMKGNLKKHMKTCSVVYRCEICSKVYLKRYYYEKHKENFHQKDKSYSIQKIEANIKDNSKKMDKISCEEDLFEVFSDKDLEIKNLDFPEKLSGFIERPMKKRQKKDSGRSERIVKCQICQAEYKGLRNLKSHQRAIHDKIRFNCEFCDKNYSYNVSLQKHKARHHFNSSGKDLNKI